MLDPFQHFHCGQWPFIRYTQHSASSGKIKDEENMADKQMDEFRKIYRISLSIRHHFNSMTCYYYYCRMCMWLIWFMVPFALCIGSQLNGLFSFNWDIHLFLSVAYAVYTHNCTLNFHQRTVSWWVMGDDDRIDSLLLFTSRSIDY